MKTRAGTWLLEHLVPGGMNAALAGDLLEESVRRGSAWYWRQVILAIAAGFLRHLRDEWVSIAFSFAWFFLGGESLARLNLRLFAWEIRLPWPVALGWPWSLLVQSAQDVVFRLFPFILGLGVYLLVARSFRFRAFTAGIAAILGALIVYELGITWLGAYHYHLYRDLEPLAGSLTLLLAIWIAQGGLARPQRNLASY